MRFRGTKKYFPYSTIDKGVVMYVVLSLSLLFSACNNQKIRADYEVIPLPQNIVRAEGSSFVLDNHTVIVYDSENEIQKRTANLLTGFLKEHTGLELKTAIEVPSGNFIRLTNTRKKEASESYTITVNAKNIVIEGSDEAGVFYGSLTLCKSIPVTNSVSQIQFPQVVITDAPRFRYRGMMLDVARHFYSVDFVKKYIDLLALHNINYFHWHLTDDQGWRIEIKKYPELTEIGSKRKQTIVGMSNNRFDGIPHEGFYTQEEIKEVVDYAAERFITVVPEIDIPGHTLSVLACHPELGCTGGPYEVCDHWGVFEDVLCAGNEGTYTFLQDVFDEIISLFPSEYIHIGGDECPKKRWEVCGKCQARIAALRLKSDTVSTAEDKLQGYLVKRVEEYLNGKGKRIIGWDEVLKSDVAKTTTIMSWQGVKGGIAAAKAGHNVIMSPNTQLYFDYFETIETDSLPYAYPGYNPLERVYHYNPVSEELTAEEQKNVIGVQANLWTEFIADSVQVEKMVLPRMGALAEIQWSQNVKTDYADFLDRLYKFSQLYKKLGYSSSSIPFDIQVAYEPDTLAQQLLLKFSVFDSIPIYYTLDGTEPTTSSLRYDKPISISRSHTVKARGIGNGRSTAIYVKQFHFNKATLKPVTLQTTPLPQFSSPASGSAMVDGRKGNKILHGGNTWTGFYNQMALTVDLKDETEINRIEAGVLLVPYQGEIEVETSYSTDGKSFEPICKKRESLDGYTNVITDFPTIKSARYIRIVVKSSTPHGIICDEIGVE